MVERVSVDLSNKTLVLNSGYQPLRVISWQRAIVLVLLEKAKIVSEKDSPILTKSLNINKPDVIRLVKYFKVNSKPRLNKINLLIRDGFKCQYCLKDLNYNDSTQDHVIPKCHDGKSTWENLVIACKSCNNKKGGKLLKDTNLILRKEPKPLEFKQFYIKDCPKSWEDYISKK